MWDDAEEIFTRNQGPGNDQAHEVFKVPKQISRNPGYPEFSIFLDFFNFLISRAFGALNSELQEITNPELWVE